MNSILQTLLTVAPLKVGIFSLADYFGKKLGSINFKFVTISISVSISILYVAINMYVIYQIKYNNAEFIFKRLPHLILLILSIIIVASIFLLNYYSFDDAKKYCDKINKMKNSDYALIYSEKTLTLLYGIIIFSMVMNFTASYKKFRKDDIFKSVELSYKFYISFILGIVICLIKLYQLYIILNTSVPKEQVDVK